jgi:hypothetical protein
MLKFKVVYTNGVVEYVYYATLTDFLHFVHSEGDHVADWEQVA